MWVKHLFLTEADTAGHRSAGRVPKRKGMQTFYGVVISPVFERKEHRLHDRKQPPRKYKSMMISEVNDKGYARKR